ncbi:MAG: CatA-like O-acetyltransferase [Acidobacteriota bacterium]
MEQYLDLDSWARRDTFEFFRNFDKPYFNVCVRLDVTNLLLALRKLNPHSKPNVTLAYHYFALRVANELEPFRYRLRKDEVVVHPIIHAGTTVMLLNGSFALAYFDYHENFAEFIAEARRAVDETLEAGVFQPRREHDARIYCTTLPWLAFTSFSHARNWGREDSVPRLAFGKFIKDNERTLLPFSVEVHHALVDGSDVGRYVTRLEEVLAKPDEYLS